MDLSNFSSPELTSRKFISDPETSLEQDSDRVHVYIRVRPLFQSEKRDSVSVQCVDAQSLSVEAAFSP